ncbi:MAG: response regulator [Thermodesulfobacteriota bacterium]
MKDQDMSLKTAAFLFPDPRKTLLPKDAKTEFIRDFVLSWKEMLARLETTALQIEAGQDDDDSLGKIKRMLHTVKGDAAVVGFPAISDVFHRAEDALEELIRGGRCPTEFLLSVKDWLEQVIDNIGDMEAEAPERPAGPTGLQVASDGNDGKRSTMKVLIVEDDFTGRLMLQKMMSAYGDCHIAVDGREAVQAFRLALDSGQLYDLILLDVMMPEMNGQEVLKEIRRLESKAGIKGLDGVKIIMTTALGDKNNVMQAFREQCDGYLVKPIDKGKLAKLIKEIR